MLARLIALAVLLVAVPAVAEEETVPLPCERACMEGMADDLLNAFAAHNAGQLQLAPFARYTDNGQAMRVNDWIPQAQFGAPNSKSKT